jgi:hypothetical protein
MSFGLYSIGFATLIGGLIYAASLVHMPAHWIAVGAVITFRSRDSVRCKGDASERSCGITVLSESDSSLANDIFHTHSFCCS